MAGRLRSTRAQRLATLSCLALVLCLVPGSSTPAGGSVERSAALAVAGARDRTVPPSSPAPAREGLAPLPGVDLYFTDSGGAGDAVIFLHPVSGNHEIFDPNVEAFERKGYRVVTFDRRNWGHSVAKPATGPQPGTVAQDLDNLMDYLDIERAHVVSVAGGTFVALDFAAWKPQRLLSLVAAASTGAFTSTEPIMAALSARLENPTPDIPRWFREVGPSYRALNPEGLARWLEIEEHGQQRDANGVLLPTQPQRSANSFAKVAAINAPTLILSGAADLVSPPPVMAEWSKSLVAAKEVRFAVVPEAGHAVNWEFPDAFNEDVLAFLKRHSVCTRQTRHGGVVIPRCR